MNRKHAICYTLATFWECQRHQNIDIWVSKTNTFVTGRHSTHISVPKINIFGTGHHNTTKPGTQWPGTGYPGSWDRVPKYQNTFAREAQFPCTLGSVFLPRATKIIDFTTHTTTCCNEQKTYYLLYFSYILCMPKTPKYRHLGIQNQHFRNTTKPGTQLPHPDTRNPDPCCQES